MTKKEYTIVELIAREAAFAAFANECAKKVDAILRKIDEAQADGDPVDDLQAALSQAKKKQAEACKASEAEKVECDAHGIPQEQKDAIAIKQLVAAMATGGVARYARYIPALAQTFKACDKIGYVASVYGRVDCLTADDDDAKRLAKDKSALARKVAAEVSSIVSGMGVERFNASKVETAYICGGGTVTYTTKGKPKVKALSANVIFSRAFTIAALRLNGTSLKEVLTATLETTAAKELFAGLQNDFPEMESKPGKGKKEKQAA